MKRLLLVAVIMTMSIFGINEAKAQVNVNVNISSQPLWGPTGHDHVDYYYLPDIDIYYYVPSGQYIYFANGRWVWVYDLPLAYRDFDFYNAYKVVLNTPRPYLKHSQHVTQYKQYRNASNKQVVIRDSREAKYAVVKGHANYKEGNNQNVGSSRNSNRASQGNNSRVQERKTSSSNNTSRPTRSGNEGSENRTNKNNSNNNRSGGRG